MKEPTVPSRRNAPWLLSQWLLRIIFSLWLRYRSKGRDNLRADEGGLVLANHQSFLDPLLIGLPLSRPVSFLARDSLFRIPLLGPFLRATFVLPVNRDAAGSDSIRELVTRMKHGFLVGIFPEGTRTTDGAVADFKPGFVALLKRCDQPVYPIGIGGANRAMPKGAWFLRPRQVCVVYGEPIDPEELQALAKQGRSALLEFIRNRVVECADEADAWALGECDPHDDAAADEGDPYFGLLRSTDDVA
ncbi:lysophospholipid acyltransferase family protein [Stratiformator vulcanicus]|nr:lysophospholipid acyltransferase family protein [Stratiformator vulcanicus]